MRTAEGFLRLYGPAVGTSVDRVVADCRNTRCVLGLIAGGNGCPDCIGRLGETRPTDSASLREAALIDRFDERVRRSEDDINDDEGGGRR